MFTSIYTGVIRKLEISINCDITLKLSKLSLVFSIIRQTLHQSVRSYTHVRL